jgi:hypothetical protein
VRNFGLLFAGLAAAVGGYLMYAGSDAWRWLAWALGFFLLTGLVGHTILRPIYVWWMRFAFLLGWVNTRILLTVFFYCILTPTALVLRLMGKDLIDKKVDRNAQSYWKMRKEGTFDPAQAERLF